MEKQNLTSIEFGGRVFDLSKALPLKVKDWKVLRKMDVFKNDDTDPMDRSFAVVLYVLKKADDSVTLDFVDELTMGEVQVLNDLIMPTEKEDLNRPT